jgi:hypothetical protein
MTAKEKTREPLLQEGVAHNTIPSSAEVCRVLMRTRVPGRVSAMADNTLEKRVPDLTEEELQIARENLDAYLELAWEIFEDMRAQEQDGLLKSG